MATRVYSVVEAFDAVYLIAEDLARTHDVTYKLFMNTDSPHLLHALTKRKHPDEQRLIIGVIVARKPYERY